MANDETKDDQFFAARANIRETVKWLITAFAALATAILGGSPLTGFGALDHGPRLAVAILGGLAGMICVFWAIKLAVDILVRDSVFFGEIHHYPELVTYIDAHSEDLLPIEYPSFAAFAKERALAIAIVNDDNASDDDRKVATAFLITAREYVGSLAGIAALENMRAQFRRSGRMLFVLAVLMVVFIGVFSWAANPPKPDDEDRKLTVGTLHELAPLPAQLA
jgi:hypothetical protein